MIVNLEKHETGRSILLFLSKLAFDDHLPLDEQLSNSL
jgi:hypothetical protein